MVVEVEGKFALSLVGDILYAQYCRQRVRISYLVVSSAFQKEIKSLTEDLVELKVLFIIGFYLRRSEGRRSR